MTVELVITTHCPKCKLLKTWLEKRGVPFKVYNLDDPEDHSQLIMRDIYIVETPVLIVNGKLYTTDSLFNENGELNQNLMREILEE